MTELRWIAQYLLFEKAMPWERFLVCVCFTLDDGEHRPRRAMEPSPTYAKFHRAASRLLRLLLDEYRGFKLVNTDRVRVKRIEFHSVD